MNGELIAAARDCLNLRLIALRNSELKLDPDFDPTVPTELELQTKISLKSASGSDLAREPAASPNRIVRGYVEAGVRFLFPRSADTNTTSSSKPADEERVAAELLAVFVAEYECIGEKIPTKEAVDEFLTHNAVYHVWSYWREYVQSTLTRAALPLVTLPMMVVKPTSNKAPDAKPS